MEIAVMKSVDYRRFATGGLQEGELCVHHRQSVCLVIVRLLIRGFVSEELFQLVNLNVIGARFERRLHAMACY
jgi:hypothetical protein